MNRYSIEIKYKNQPTVGTLAELIDEQ